MNKHSHVMAHIKHYTDKYIIIILEMKLKL